MNIAEYKEILKRLSTEESKEFINNSSMEHAAAMIEELFRNAKGKVCILTDHLKPAVYDRDSLKEAVSEFLKGADNQLKIICQLKEGNSIPLSQNKFLTHLQEHKDKIELFQAVGTTKNIQRHFMVTTTTKDNYALRLEMDTQYHIATGTFNAGKEEGDKLCNYFNGWIQDKTKATKIESNTVWA